MNHRKPLVNGNSVSLWGQDQRTDSAARRVAAQLPRAARNVRQVSADHRPGLVCIWFDPVTGASDEPVTHAVPDGWNVVEFDHFSDGTIAVTVESEADR